MTASPLSHAVVDVVGHPFHVIWTPEDGAIRAGGFAMAEDPGAESLLRRLERLAPELAARGVSSSASSGGGGDRDGDDRGGDDEHGIVEALRAYDRGDLGAIDGLRVAQPETPFRGEVWRALRRVPAGGAVTYTELAALAGRPSAVRAAASGCANNLVALVVPCHRIVRTDGGLGGYLFGVDIKERLLRHEAAIR